MHEERRITTHEHTSPFISPPIFPRASREEIAQQRRADREATVTASREAADRDIAYVRAMNPSPVPKLEARALRQPVMPADFDAAALDKNIYSRGVAFDRERLVSLGSALFDDLLSRDRDVRSFQRVLFDDLSSWPSVLQSFAANNALVTNVPSRRNADIVAGRFADREQAARIDSFDDLWKIALEPESARRVLSFHDAFVSLVFGQSLLERLSSDGRVRSRLFCGGKLETVSSFTDWLSALNGAHFSVTIVEPLFSVLAWLCGERQSAPDLAQLANQFLGVRSPSAAQIKLVRAVIDGFLRSHASWSLWNHVGRATRQLIDHATLSVWRSSLAERYKHIARFQNDLRMFFMTPGREGYEFNANAYRTYLDRQLSALIAQVSLIAALEMRDVTVARFNDFILCEGNKPKSRPTAERIEFALESAFNGSRFHVDVHEAQS